MAGLTKITQGALGTLDYFSVDGTITASAFSGDGSALTNVPAGISSVKNVVITSSSTYTPTSGTKFFKVYACGGGGGGGGCSGQSGADQATHGGSAGSTTVKIYNATEMGATASITIGGGGGGGNIAGSNGGNGGSTTFAPAGTGLTITGIGGRFSYGNASGADSIGLTNQSYLSTSLQNGDYVLFGEHGYMGHFWKRETIGSSGGYWRGGAGGNSFFGRGGAGIYTNSNYALTGNNGALGGGGSGTIAGTSDGGAGGAGGSGIVVIEEYA